MIRNHLYIAAALFAANIFTTSLYAQGGGECSTCGIGGGYANTEGFGHRHGWIYHSSWGDYWAQNQSMQRPWHGEYYWLRTGQPTALIVPPTVTMQSNYSWGVSQNTMTPVWHQFGGHAPSGGGGGVFKATPYWPSHTNQFGVYPVRGPW